MRTVLFLVQKEFLQIFRNKTMLVLILIMPVFQTLLLSFAANYEVKNLSLTVIDHDKSSTSRTLIDKFTASGYFKLNTSTESYKEAGLEMDLDASDLALEIPPQFERNMVREGTGSVGITINAVNAQKAGIASAYSGMIVREFNQEIAAKWAPKLAAASVATNGNINVTYSNWYNEHLDYKAFMVPGILGEIVSLIICFLTALNIVREREMGTIEQLNVTPIKKWQFILGKLMPFWGLSLVMMAVGLTAGWLVFKIPIRGDLSLVFLYTFTFAPCMLGIGFLISNYAETQQQAMFSAWFFVLIFILMCGLFTPADSMPEWAQWINILNPVHYFVDFMRKVLLKGAGFAEIRENYFSVLTYAIVVNALAVWTYRKRV